MPRGDLRLDIFHALDVDVADLVQRPDRANASGGVEALPRVQRGGPGALLPHRPGPFCWRLLAPSHHFEPLREEDRVTDRLRAMLAGYFMRAYVARCAASLTRAERGRRISRIRRRETSPAFRIARYAKANAHPSARRSSVGGGRRVGELDDLPREWPPQEVVDPPHRARRIGLQILVTHRHQVAIAERGEPAPSRLVERMKPDQQDPFQSRHGSSAGAPSRQRRCSLKSKLDHCVQALVVSKNASGSCICSRRR